MFFFYVHLSSNSKPLKLISRYFYIGYKNTFDKGNLLTVGCFFVISENVVNVSYKKKNVALYHKKSNKQTATLEQAE